MIGKESERRERERGKEAEGGERGKEEEKRRIGGERWGRKVEKRRMLRARSYYKR